MCLHGKHNFYYFTSLIYFYSYLNARTREHRVVLHNCGIKCDLIAKVASYVFICDRCADEIPLRKPRALFNFRAGLHSDTSVNLEKCLSSESDFFFYILFVSCEGKVSVEG